MQIAIVAATEAEINLLSNMTFAQHQVSFHVHGVGMIPACFHLQEMCATSPDLIIQCGIAGAYAKRFVPGDTVIVKTDLFDHGVEDGQQLLDIFDTGFASPTAWPYTDGRLPCPFLAQWHTSLPLVHSLTVSVASGSAETIEKRLKKYDPDIESMEGAALHYVCLMNQIPFLQIRTISNLVEVRNKLNWNIPLALQNNALDISNIISQI